MPVDGGILTASFVFFMNKKREIAAETKNKTKIKSSISR